MQNEKNPHKLKMLLVMAVFALPVVASYLMYFLFPPEGGKRNYGELIKIVTLPETLNLATPQGEAVSLKTLRGKWVLLQVDRAQCDSPCEKKLYAMRQVRLMQGKEQERLLRLWLLEDGGMPSEKLQKEFEGTQWLTDAQQMVIGKLAAERDVKDYIYMIDPLGNVMMRWPAEPDLKRMFKDIERLLRASQIG